MSVERRHLKRALLNAETIFSVYEIYLKQEVDLWRGGAGPGDSRVQRCLRDGGVPICGLQLVTSCAVKCGACLSG